MLQVCGKGCVYEEGPEECHDKVECNVVYTVYSVYCAHHTTHTVFSGRWEDYTVTCVHVYTVHCTLYTVHSIHHTMCKVCITVWAAPVTVTQVVASVVSMPEEVCDLNPQKICRFKTTLVIYLL